MNKVEKDKLLKDMKEFEQIYDQANTGMLLLKIDIALKKLTSFTMFFSITTKNEFKNLFSCTKLLVSELLENNGDVSKVEPDIINEFVDALNVVENKKKTGGTSFFEKLIIFSYTMVLIFYSENFIKETPFLIFAVSCAYITFFIDYSIRIMRFGAEWFAFLCLVLFGVLRDFS